MAAPRLALLLVVMAAGCGGGNDETAAPAAKTIDEATYVREADAICADTATRVGGIQEDVQRAADMEAAADVLEQQAAALREMRERLVALGVPKGNEEFAREMVRDIEDAEPHLDAMIEALREGDEEAVGAAAQRYRSASLESAAQARDSGLAFEVCGSGA